MIEPETAVKITNISIPTNGLVNLNPEELEDIQQIY